MSHKPWAGGMAAPGLVQSTLGFVPFVLGSGKVLFSGASGLPPPLLGMACRGSLAGIPPS